MIKINVCKYKIELKLHKLEIFLSVPINTRVQLFLKIGSQLTSTSNKFKFIHKESILFESLSLTSTFYLCADSHKLAQQKPAEIQLVFINSKVQNKGGSVKLDLEDYIGGDKTEKFQ